MFPNIPEELRPKTKPWLHQRYLKVIFSLETEINSREDLIVSGTGEKVSGTASKLNAYNSYHHCTLLIDVDRNSLRKSLRKAEINGFHSRATKSVPSPVLNLKTLNPEMDIENTTLELSKHYCHFVENSSMIHQIVPEMFQEFNTHLKTLQDWFWIFGKSPLFSISNPIYIDGQEFSLKITVDKGKITEVATVLPGEEQSDGFLNIFIDCLNEGDNDWITEKIRNTMIGCVFEEKQLIERINRLKNELETEMDKKKTGNDSNVPEIRLRIDTICLAMLNCYNKCK